MTRTSPTFRKARLAIAALFGAVASLTVINPAAAADAASGDGTIKISGSWTRATPAGAKVAGGFLKITNTGATPDRLMGGTMVSAGKVEVHQMSMADGVMKMSALEQGLEIKPGEMVELKPGGFHIMFIDLAAPVKEGDHLEGTLVFQRAGTIKLQYDAAAMGAKSEVAAPGHMKH